MFCTNCGAQLPDDAQFCTECGQSLAAEQPTTVAAPVEDATRVMPHAEPDGLDVPAEQTMGAPAASAGAFCTNCGARIPDGCAFCVECGAPADGSGAGVGSTAPGVAIPSEMLDQPRAGGEPPRRRNTGLVVGIVVALVIVLGCGSVVALHYFGVMGDPAFLRFLPMREQPADDAGKDSEGEADSDEGEDPEKDSDEKKSEKDSEKDADEDSDEKSDKSSDEKSDKKSDEGSKKDSGSDSSSSSSSSSASSSYVLPDSDTRVYSTSELSGLSDWELYVARNEIYARHGRGFQNQDLRNYFAGQSWYREQYSPEEFDSYVTLNSVEQQNADTILKLEKSRGSQYVS